MSVRIGTAAPVLWALYLYVVCILSEGGTLFLYVRVFRLTQTLHPSTCQLLRPIGCTSRQNLRGKQTWLASPMIDAIVVLVYE